MPRPEPSLPARACAAAAIVALAAGAVAAGEVFSAEGAAVGVDRSSVIPAGEGRELVVARVDYGPVALLDPEAPLDGASGPCFGALEVAGTAVEGSGYCTWTDLDGDLVVIAWRATGRGRGAGVAGEWMAFGGTGKWRGAAGGGAYEEAAQPGTNERRLYLEGVMALP